MFESLEPLAPELFWILCTAFIIALLLAFSVGANDVSNSFGTSVGSHVLTVTQACILATIFEIAGSTLLGYSVCDTFRRKMYDIDLYKDSQKELMLGALACLIGSATWNLIATALKMPISGTHSIVGATIGFSVVLKGWESIRWMDMARIVASWFASPILSGIISSLIYMHISKTIIRKVDPLKNGLRALPLYYGTTIFINVASVVIGGPKVFGLDSLPWYAGLLIALVLAGIVICVVAMIMVPRMRRQILDEVVLKLNTQNKQSAATAPKTQLHTTFMSSTPTGSSVKRQVAAFDNAAFKPDGSAAREAPEAIEPAEPPKPARPKRELTLDPNQLEAGPSEASSSSARPPLAPKPPHLKLKRQLGADMEEVDLGPRVTIAEPAKSDELGGGGAGGSAGPGKASGSGERPGMIRGERYEVFRLFSSLQIMTACFASFAHGTNDVSNAVAPLVPIWNIYANGFEDPAKSTQIWILAFGGIGICIGLWAWGRAVMGTVADGLTQLTPSKGFAIELGAAISVLAASKFGLPISTTHCKVGSVVIVGLVSSKFLSQDNLLDMSAEERAEQSDKNQQAVDWRLFGNIALTWVVTVPLAALASALMMLLLKWLAL